MVAIEDLVIGKEVQLQELRRKTTPQGRLNQRVVLSGHTKLVENGLQTGKLAWLLCAYVRLYPPSLISLYTLSYCREILLKGRLSHRMEI